MGVAVLVVVGVVAIALAAAYVAGPPARVTVSPDTVRVALRGLWPLLALRRTIEVPRSAVRHATVVEDARRLRRGMRIGTEVPGGPIAGRFVSKGSSAFWALRGSRAVVLELTDSAYDRIVVETDDPAEVVDALGLTGAAPPLDRSEARGPARAPLPVAVGIAGAVLGAPLVIAASLASSMPSPVAIHWGLDGTPNGSMSLLPAALLLTAIAAIGVVPAAIDVARHGPNAHAIGVAVFMWGIGCAALAATLASNRGVDDWRDAHLSAWWIVVIIGVPLALAVAVHAVVRRE